MSTQVELDRCQHGHTAGETCPTCDVEWDRIDPRCPLFRCSVCHGLFLERDRDTHTH